MFNFDRVMLNAQPSNSQLPESSVLNNQIIKITHLNNDPLKSMHIPTNKTESINHYEVRDEISPTKPLELQSAMHT